VPFPYCIISYESLFLSMIVWPLSVNYVEYSLVSNTILHIPNPIGEVHF